MEIQIAISPVTVWPSSASIIRITAGALGPPPTFHYRLFEADASEVLKAGSVRMTPEQWGAWGTQTDDESYIGTCVLTNLGLSTA